MNNPTIKAGDKAFPTTNQSPNIVDEINDEGGHP